MKQSLASALLLFAAADLPAQGATDFLNFETPQVKPLAVARVGGRDYLLACNTPDSSVAVYDVAGPKLVGRVAVGLEPVSVTWSPLLQRFYTANMTGDSVSVVRLEPRPEAPPVAVLERTEWVGDEPMMVALAQDGLTLFVTHGSQSALSWRHALSLQPVVPGASERIPLVDDFQQPAQGLKEPRAVLVAGARLYVLGLRGGHSFFHDFDLFGFDFAAGKQFAVRGLGTLKTNLTLAQNGDLWLVGADAQNHLRGLQAVAAARTGFVKSLVHRVRGTGGPSPVTATRDLNLDAQGQPVARSRALAQPMDVVLLEDQGGVRKAFVAAFQSDRLGIVVPEGDDAARWTIRTLDIPLARGSRNAMAGPRGLALKPANPAARDDPGPRLYVLNRLDNSLAVVDPAAETVLDVVPLAHDPTPLHVREGRPFLYGARFSGSGFVACASCHIDGRTDGLAWDLSDPPSTKPTPLDAALLDGVTDSRIQGVKDFPVVKGAMVTQSLQGLLDQETPAASQALFTNQPLHWRGDTDFQGFNGAFVKLQGMPNLAGPSDPPRGLSEADMRAYELFVHSISYPPNPEQPLARVYSGSFGTPDQADGSLAQLGLKLFHTERIASPLTGDPDPTLAGRSCVQCHFLPEGSNNRITRLGVSTPQPIETAALRGLRQKEAVLEADASRVGAIVLQEFGLEHQGTLRSINDFTQFVFGHDFPGELKARLDAITRFVREFDTGVAPLVGFPLTVDRLAASRSDTRLALDFFEGQAGSADVGIAVRARLGGRERGFWFDAGTGRYAEEPGPLLVDRQGLLAQVGPDDLLVFQATPVGSERRIAAPSGKASIAAGPAPSALRLLPMRPNRANERIPSLAKNWRPGPLVDANAFAWTGVYSGTSQPVPEPVSLKAIRLLQYGLLQDGPELGLARLRHEAPRRFRVAGRDIRPGSTLVLLVPNDPTTPPPYDRQTRPTLPIVLPLYATADRAVDGAIVFTTAAEADARLLYTLCLGGPAAPGVGKALAGQLAEPPPRATFDPVRWNRHWLWVINEDGTYGTGGWQALRLE